MTNPTLNEVLATENEIEVLQDSDLVDVAGGLNDAEELEWCVGMCGTMSVSKPSME